MDQSGFRSASNDSYVARWGRVQAGTGRATSALKRIDAELSDYFGKPVCPGTLNIVLDWPVAFKNANSLRFGGLSNRFWPVLVRGEACLVQRWIKCPLHIAEIVAPVNMRERFNLRDGNRICIDVARSGVAPVRLRQRVAWAAVWMFHRSATYTDSAYNDSIWQFNRPACILASQDGDSY